MKRTFIGFVALLLGVLTFWLLYRADRDGVVPDAAKLAGETVQDLPESDSHAFGDMDSEIALSEEEVKGRNTWLLWTAGNQTFWDGMARNGLGTGDLLKAIDSRSRNTRFKQTGLINQPGFSAALKPDAYGLWIDEGPQEPGVSAAVYGRPSGVIGLRLFPNPQFDAVAVKHWNPGLYYSDRKYFEDRNLIRPYVVGMACGFCHVSFNPERPPDDPEHPAWSNLSSAIGNQYLRAGPIFGAAASDDSFPRQVLQSWPAGTIDTSFIATDHLNNPSNINPINLLAARAAVAHEERMAKESLHLPGESRVMRVPHVLKDGADSVGLIGALSRVYVSIGEYSEEWLRDHDVLLGGQSQRPFLIARAQRGSIYWQVTATKLPDLANFLSRMMPPQLRSAPGGAAYLTTDEAVLQRGKIVFAERCALCHSSKQPANIPDRNSVEYLAWMRAEVLRPDFLEGNFLSTEERIPLPIIQTNAARALATNATRDHVWDNFSSETYKQSPSAGEIDVRNIVDRTTKRVALPAGGPGYYRVPSLAGIWASAPFLHNNALGTYTGDPTVEGRMIAFHDSMEKLLWPDTRSADGLVFRTSVESYLQIPSSYLPWQLKLLAHDGTLRIGPIPAGTPVDLLASADVEMSFDRKTLQRVLLIKELQSALLRVQTDRLDDAAAQKLMSQLGADLLKISNCSDFIQDRGHYFGADLTDSDKRALIEFVKTF